MSIFRKSKKPLIIDHFGEQAWLPANAHAKTDFITSPVSRRKLYLIFAVFNFCFLVLVGRVAWLQLKKGDEYLKIAEENRIRREVIPASRGLILSNNLEPLVANEPSFYLSLIPSLLPKNQKLETLDFLEKDFGVDPEEVEQRIADFKKYAQAEIPIFDDIDYATALKLKISITRYPWLRLAEETKRKYLTAKTHKSFSHLLGYTSRVTENDLRQNSALYPHDKIGRLGIEAAFDSYLRGQDGFYEIEVDALGHPKEKIEREKPIDGHNVVLSIDANLQKKAEMVLRETLAKHNKKKGVVLVSNVHSGKLLTIVSWPSFDSNIFSKKVSKEEINLLFSHPDQPLFNRAISGAYPSGSIIKPIYAAAALAEGMITRATTFLSTGGLQIGEWNFPDWKAGGHGPTNVIKALAESVNTFFYIVGGGYGREPGLGLERMTDYLRRFGLGESTGSGLLGEKTGFVPTVFWKKQNVGTDWFIGDTYHLAIGQGFITVTPLQMLLATAVIANGGTLYKPLLVTKIFNTTVEQAEEFLPAPRTKDLVDDGLLRIVREGMRAAVTYGSARFLADLPVAVAGKTGTAEWRKGRSPHAWFVGFAPYENPEISIVVLVEEGGEGSAIAVPIAKQVLAAYFKRE